VSLIRGEDSQESQNVFGGTLSNKERRSSERFLKDLSGAKKLSRGGIAERAFTRIALTRILSERQGTLRSKEGRGGKRSEGNPSRPTVQREKRNTFWKKKSKFAEGEKDLYSKPKEGRLSHRGLWGRILASKEGVTVQEKRRELLPSKGEHRSKGGGRDRCAE